MTDHMQTPGLPEEKPAQGCPFGHGSGAPLRPLLLQIPAMAGMTRNSIFRSR
jgi:hypothetical protein